MNDINVSLVLELSENDALVKTLTDEITRMKRMQQTVLVERKFDSVYS